MKTLLIALSLIISSTSLAQDPSAKSLKSAIETFEKLYPLSYGEGPQIQVANYEVKEGSTIGRTLRHYIWKNSHHWTSEVHSQEIERNEESYREGAAEATVLIHYDDETLPKIEKISKDFADQIVGLLKWDSIELHTISYGSDEGGCLGIAAVDTFYKEFVFFESCQSE